MDAYYEDDAVQLHLGDCLDILPTLADASVDAVVTDAPYEISMMGRAWDSTGIAYNVDVWRQCLRVLKPGGHLLAFGAPRTYHRMAVAIEDAGFEIRDSLHWVFGAGFPKGQNIAKSIDRQRNDRSKVLQVTAWLGAARDAAGWTTKRIDEAFGTNGMASHWTAIASKAATIPTMQQWATLRGLLGFDDTEIMPLVTELNGRKGTVGEAWEQREVVGHRHSGLANGNASVFLNGTTQYEGGMVPVTTSASDSARRWEGWNTSLKPAHEPIVLARKSTGFNTTVANVLEHGTGALHVDACRTVAGQDYREKCASVVGIASPRNGDTLGEWTGTREDSAHTAGRWPTNILLGHGPDCIDGGDCQPACPVAETDAQSGVTPSNARANKGGSMGYHGGTPQSKGFAGDDSGGASRFFPVFRYEAKAPASERPRLPDGTAHNTVKPLNLLRWLVRLVTPPGGTVLDPFAGSGTTLEACRLESFQSIGIEKDPGHAELCKIRLAKPYMTDLFGGAA